MPTAHRMSTTPCWRHFARARRHASGIQLRSVVPHQQEHCVELAEAASAPFSFSPPPPAEPSNDGVSTTLRTSSSNAWPTAMLALALVSTKRQPWCRANSCPSSVVTCRVPDCGCAVAGRRGERRSEKEGGREGRRVVFRCVDRHHTSIKTKWALR